MIGKEEFSAYFKEKNQNSKNTPGFVGYLKEQKGISEQVLNDFNIGYDSEWIHPTTEASVANFKKSAIIIPIDKSNYVAHRVNDNMEIAVGEDAWVFNQEAISKNKPIFVTEGILKSLRFISAKLNAVGIIGTIGITKLQKIISKNKINQPVFLCLKDENLKAFLENKNIPYKDISEKIEEVLNGNNFQDTITHFVENNAKKLIEEFSIKQNEAQKQKKQAREEYIQEKSKHKFYKIFRDVANYKINSSFSTSFSKLDSILGEGLRSGNIHVLGAEPGIGKTTFALQIATHIALQEKHCVLFYSLEMAEKDIHLKNLSRLTKNNQPTNATPKTPDEIAKFIQNVNNRLEHEKTNEDYEIYRKVMEIYEEHVLNKLIILTESDEINGIENEIEKHMEVCCKNPIVFIDFLQYMKFNINLDKRIAIDNLMVKFRKFAKKNNVLFFLISSLNRAGRDITNSLHIGLSSFKESGNIEYNADVILTLESSKNNEYIELRIIKNRFGKTYKHSEYVNLEFYREYSYFKEQEIINNEKLAGGGIL
jgi:replicative DNA helicase/twinkle protein